MVNFSTSTDVTERKAQPLIILEGPDCSGKSTLAHELQQRMGSVMQVLHHGPYPRVSDRQLPRFYLEGMFPLLDRWQGQIMDRSWLSEQVYGPIYRQVNRISTATRRQLERIALRHGAVVVLCLPKWEAVRTKWAERKGLDPEAEMLDDERQLEQVYSLYENLTTDLPIVRYDYNVHHRDLNQLVRQISRVASDLHKPLRTVGSANAKVVLVGEKPSDLTDVDTLKQYPFCSFSSQGSSRWVTEKLIDNAIPEADLLWANAEDGLWWLRDAYVRPTIALGDAASRALDKLDFPHTKVQHPQFWKRFHGDEPYLLISEILKHL